MMVVSMKNILHQYDVHMAWLFAHKSINLQQ